MPATIGPYAVLSVLGEGGMGVVYRARHTVSGEVAAVKTVLVHDERGAQGIRREIRALARLRHPGIARILDEGLDQGRPYYAMEILEGQTLSAWLAPSDDPVGADAATSTAPRSPGAAPRADARRADAATAATGPMSSAEAGRVVAVLGIMRRLCDTLAFLHGEGVVHRDLKPSNVLVTARGEPVLIDFGLATQFEGRLSLGLQAASGAVLATPLYMAPELLSGRVVDARADLYALGCMLYQLLAGRAPFGGPPAAIVQGHLALAPTPLERLAPALPAELCRLVGRLMAKRPSERLGYAEDVAAVLTLCLSDAPPPATTPRARAYVYQPELSGRDAELAALVAALPVEGRPTGPTTTSAVTIVSGEAGIGKTRLLLELAHAAGERGVPVLMGECQRQVGVTLGALERPLQEIVDACRVGGVAERAMADRVFGARGPVLAPHIPEVRSLAGQALQPAPAELPAALARDRLVRAVVDSLAAFADLRPLLVLIDDLQWADDVTLACVQRLAPPARAPAALRLVAAHRADEDGPASAWLAASPAIARVALSRLGPAAIDAMVGDMLALPGAAARALGAQIYRHSEGNPFFVAEYLRLAVGEGRLGRDAAGAWRLPAGAATDVDPIGQGLALPTSLREVMTRRLSGLSPEAEALVTAAAVLGVESGLELLGATSGLGEDALQLAASELARRQILTEVRPGLLRFGHGKLGELAYDRIASERLAALHAGAARAIEALCAAGGAADARRPAHAAALARHYQAAGDPLEAVRCLRLAARHAARGGAARDAIALLERAIALADAQPESPESMGLAIDARVDIYGPRMQVHSAADEENLRICQAAEPLARRLGDPVRLARVEANLAGCWFGRGDYEKQIAHGQRSMAYAEQSGSLANVASAAFIVAMCYYQTARMDALFELAPRVIGLIDRTHARTESFGAPYPPVITLCTALALGHAHRGDRRAAEASLADGLAVARDARHPYAEALCHIVWSWATALFGVGPAPAEHGAAALATARELGSPGLEMMAASSVGLGHLRAGRGSDAVAALDDALALSARIGYPTFQTTTLWGLALAHLERGDLDATRAACEAGLAFSARTGERKLDPDFLRLQGEAHLRTPRGEAAAEAAARASLALAERQQARVLAPHALLLLGRALSRRGARDEALATLARARDEAAAVGLADVPGAAALTLAALQA